MHNPDVASAARQLLVGLGELGDLLKVYAFTLLLPQDENRNMKLAGISAGLRREAERLDSYVRGEAPRKAGEILEQLEAAQRASAGTR